MGKSNRWAKIFAPPHEKVQVAVGGQLAEMTETQSWRYNELSGAFSFERCTLAEAAQRRQQSETELLAAAGDGHLLLFVNCAGLSGHWVLEQARGQAARTAPMVLKSGYLALPASVCSELAQTTSTITAVVEFAPTTDSKALELDVTQLAKLTAGSGARRYFCLDKPLVIRRDAVYLIEASDELR